MCVSQQKRDVQDWKLAPMDLPDQGFASQTCGKVIDCRGLMIRTRRATEPRFVFVFVVVEDYIGPSGLLCDLYILSSIAVVFLARESAPLWFCKVWQRVAEPTSWSHAGRANVLHSFS
mmetsp:Transcript_164477/g.522939  ORF Transcript_164477/g.522939 Transcript_164477/m.522939 type:complete len:118 (+) Transcript_164477:2072-2425(+)